MPRPPRWLRPFAEFRGADHLAGAPGIPALKANVLRVLRREGVATGDVDRVVMLGQRPGAGAHLRPDDRLLVLRRRRRPARRASPRCTTPTASGTPTCCGPTTSVGAATDKEFYVSPFNDVEGQYAMRFHLTPQRVGWPSACSSATNHW